MSGQDLQRLCHALSSQGAAGLGVLCQWDTQQAGHNTDHLKWSNFYIPFLYSILWCLLYLNMLASDAFMCEHILVQHGIHRSGSQGINLQREFLWQMLLHWGSQHAQAQCQKPYWKGIWCEYSWNFCLGWQNPKCTDPGHEMIKQIPFRGNFSLASQCLPRVPWQYKFLWQQPKQLLYLYEALKLES